MIGVGVAEKAGLMAALIRKLVARRARRALTFIIVLLGVLSSVASDAGYLILIPLGAAAFLQPRQTSARGDRRRLRGRRAPVRRERPDHADRQPADRDHERGASRSSTPNVAHLTANLYFAIVSTFFVAVVVTLMTERLIEPRLGGRPADAGRRRRGRRRRPRSPEARPAACAAPSRPVGALIVIVLLTAIPARPCAIRSG